MRLIDNFYQSWYAIKQISEVLSLYNTIKLSVGYEEYLNFLPFDLRAYLCKIRISAHSLNIQTGRYGRNRVPRAERYCVYCALGDIEDEYDFILTCPCYEHLRRKYIRKQYYSRPNMIKFIELLRCDNKTTLTNLAKYLKLAFRLRVSLHYEN